MHVEVTESNIKIFDLVKFTGNTEEELLQAAKEAKESGHVLWCQIPDREEVNVNAFEHFGAEDAPVVGRTVEHESSVAEDLLRDIFMDPPQRGPDFNIVDVVEGEVVSNESVDGHWRDVTED